MSCKGITFLQNSCNKKCINNSDFCIVHFYMTTYTEEMMKNLTLCNCCFKFKFISDDYDNTLNNGITDNNILNNETINNNTLNNGITDNNILNNETINNNTSNNKSINDNALNNETTNNILNNKTTNNETTNNILNNETTNNNDSNNNTLNNKTTNNNDSNDNNTNKPSNNKKPSKNYANRFGTYCDSCIEHNFIFNKCSAEKCRNKKSDINEYCFQHQIYITIEKSLETNKKLCANFIKKQCTNLLNLDSEFKSCDPCRIETKNRKYYKENAYCKVIKLNLKNIDNNTLKKCMACGSKRPQYQFVSFKNDYLTSTCQICRDKRSDRYYSLKRKYGD